MYVDVQGADADHGGAEVSDVQKGLGISSQLSSSPRASSTALPCFPRLDFPIDLKYPL